MAKRKRFGFAIGMMLLMGGWGLTWYAEEQQQAYPTSRAASAVRGSSVYFPRKERWNENTEASSGVDSWVIYAAGIMLMTVGAGVTAFNLPLPESWSPGEIQNDEAN